METSAGARERPDHVRATGTARVSAERQGADSIIHAGWIIPVEPEGAVLPRHSLVIRDGRIVALLPWREAFRRYRAPVVYPRHRHALIPGLVNAHTHAAMALLRGYADDLPLERWLRERIWPAEHRHMRRRLARDGVRLAIAEMLRGGTTCFNDMYYFPESTAGEALRAGIRVQAGIRVLEGALGFGAGPEDVLEGGLSLHDRLRGEALAGASLAPYAPESVDEATLANLRWLSDHHALRVHSHVHENLKAIEATQAATGHRPLRRLERAGLLNHRLVAVHMNHLSPGERRAVAAAGVHVVHCPRSNLKLASGFCPVATLLAEGVNVALGTDGAASNNSLDMLGEMRTAALLAKGISRNPTALPAAVALRMATLNGARALGLDTETGSLQPGKQADCVAVDLDRVGTTPLHHVLPQLAYATQREQVSDVWVAGRQVLAGRHLQTLDEQHVIRRTRHWQRRIAGGSGPGGWLRRLAGG